MTLFSLQKQKKKRLFTIVAISLAVGLAAVATNYALTDFSPKLNHIKRLDKKQRSLRSALLARNQFIKENKDILIKYMRYKIDIPMARKVMNKGFNILNQLGYVTLTIQDIKENKRYYNCVDVTASVASRYEFLKTPLVEDLGVELSNLLFDMTENVDASTPGVIRFTVRKRIDKKDL